MNNHKERDITRKIQKSFTIINERLASSGRMEPICDYIKTMVDTILTNEEDFVPRTQVLEAMLNIARTAKRLTGNKQKAEKKIAELNEKLGRYSKMCLENKKSEIYLSKKIVSLQEENDRLSKLMFDLYADNEPPEHTVQESFEQYSFKKKLFSINKVMKITKSLMEMETLNNFFNFLFKYLPKKIGIKQIKCVFSEDRLKGVGQSGAFQILYNNICEYQSLNGCEDICFGSGCLEKNIKAEVFPIIICGLEVGKYVFIENDRITDPVLGNDDIKLTCDYLSTTLRNLGIQEHGRVYSKNLEIKNHTDALTGVFNRLFLDQEIKNILNLHKRYKYRLSVMMLDLDHFKRINDIHGHAMGDAVLRRFTETVSTILRESDIFARYGGEEFTLILSETNEQGAIEVANKILKATREIKIKDTNGGEDIGVTVSIGIMSCLPTEDHSCENIMKASDQAMYMAKHKGRDRFCIFHNKRVKKTIKPS